MAKPKLKKKAASSGSSSSASSAPKQKSLMESAQQIWMAGLGAFGRAQEEGSKLFEVLVREGASLEQKTRKLATGRIDDARGAVESTVAQVRERAADTWDRLEKVFEDRVSRALAKLGVPGRDEMRALTERVEELNRALRNAGRTPEAAAAKRTVRGSVDKARRSVELMAEAASDVQRASFEAVRGAVGKVAKRGKPKR